jgi:hypothetical protein
MRSAECRYFRCSWCGLNALGATVVTHPVDGGVVDHAAFVDIRDVDVSNIIDRAVVAELIAMPVAALITPSGITESIIDATVISNISTPVATIETISPPAVAPITGRPKSSDVWRLGPCSRHPVKARQTKRPVARSPDITRFRNGRLIIFRQRRRRLRSIFHRCRIIRCFAIVLSWLTVILSRLRLRSNRRCSLHGCHVGGSGVTLILCALIRSRVLNLGVLGWILIASRGSKNEGERKHQPRRRSFSQIHRIALFQIIRPTRRGFWGVGQRS